MLRVSANHSIQLVQLLPPHELPRCAEAVGLKSQNPRQLPGAAVDSDPLKQHAKEGVSRESHVSQEAPASLREQRTICTCLCTDTQTQAQGHMDT